MATNRDRSEEPRPNIIEDLLNVQRGLFIAGIEGASAMADVTQNFLTGAVQRQPFSASRSVGDVIRETPEMLAGALPTPNEMINMPRRVVDAFYREYNGSSAPRPGAPSTGASGYGAGGYRQQTDSPESTIFTSAQTYLNSIPQGGALLSSVVNHVALTTGYPIDIIRSVVLRNFVSNGTVVRNQPAPGENPLQNPVVQRMQQALTELGYTDLRADCPLLAMPDTQEKAALVAFDGDTPLVLCYPAVRSVNSPQEREAARFQAATISDDKSARFVWVSDGVSNYYLDTERDLAIAALPPYVASGGTAKP